MSKKKLNSTQVSQIVEEYNSGALLRELAKKYHVCMNTIKTYLQKSKVTFRQKVSFTEEEWVDIEYRYEYETATEISIDLGVSTSYIYRGLKKRGITIRRKGPRE